MSYLAESGRLSAEARQILTKKAIRMGAKYVLYWDDDTLPPNKALYGMHNWMECHPEAGAITAVYTTREDPPEPLIYKEHGAGAYWDFPMGPGAEPVPIFGCGAGFLLVRVQAITETIDRLQKENGEVESPVWADGRTIPHVGEQNTQRIMWGHDIRFCKILQETGWPVYVHGAYICDHLDIRTGRLFTVPKDAPGFKIQRSKNINTADYWDAIYGAEGANTWRQYPEMFEKIEKLVGDYWTSNTSPIGPYTITELGCGVGILGSRLTAKMSVGYQGYDISPVAVEMCQARHLNVKQLDMKDLDHDALMYGHCVIATELVEHLDRPVFDHVMETIDSLLGVEKFIFTVPDNCMPPEEVPEHVALFNRKLVRSYVKPYLDRWSLKFQKAGDGVHLICIMERKDGERPTKSKKGSARVQKTKTAKQPKRGRSIQKTKEIIYDPK
jgi:hypothetical protein